MAAQTDREKAARVREREGDRQTDERTDREYRG
jgi:hypothetical protein